MNPNWTPYEQFIFKSRYARYLEAESRREDLEETVDRYLDFMGEHLGTKHGYHVDDALRLELFNGIHDFESMPSMRALMTAGPALKRDNTAGFNCSYLPIDHTRSFDEAMYILLCGSGVGFSVESRYTTKLPVVPELGPINETIVVADSKEGWAIALRELIDYLYAGFLPKWDTSLVRKAGERLKTFGGRASGPEPLIELFEFVIRTFVNAQGRQLRPIECHDIMCKIGDIVVVGGVRRSAMISLSDLHDEAMAGAKGYFEVRRAHAMDVDELHWSVEVLNAYGEWENHTLEFKEEERYDIEQMLHHNKISWFKPYGHRGLANNSAVFEERPDAVTFSKEWHALIASRSGERGIFSRKAAQDQAMKNGRRNAFVNEDEMWAYGTNPCSEIILRPYQFCNLSEVVARAEDTLDDLKRKVRLATILGTFQSTLTDFPYLRDIWQKNTEDERLLGVSITGIQDHGVLNGLMGDQMLEEYQAELKAVAIEVNAELCEALGIAQSVAITCVKPSGTVSQLTNSASGIHARHAGFYIRTVRGDNKDPLTQFLINMGIPNEPCLSKPKTTTIFSFPMRAPEGAITRHDMTALQQLEIWLSYQRNWCEHKPSCTISVKDEEWMDVAAWVYKHFDEISGISFLPHFEADSSFKQMPYQDITESEYVAAVEKMPEGIDWTKLSSYEFEDNTVGSQTMACTGGVCELVDIT